jgi:putative aldouronate transport system substrate-binding protein
MKIMTAPDGEIYSLPEVGGDYALNVIPNAMFINQAWLAKLGLQTPTTTEEFYNVLKAFKTRDPNGNGKADEIPWSFQLKDWGAYDWTSFFGAFGYPVSSKDRTMIDKGKVIFSGSQQSFKDGVAYLARLYKEGLIDPEIFTQNQNGLIAKWNSDPSTVGVTHMYTKGSQGSKLTTYWNDYTALPPMKGPTGDQNWMYDNSFIGGLYDRDMMEITNKAENPEILLRWADVLYSDFETAYSVTYGMGPDPNKYWDYDANGKMKVNIPIPDKYRRGLQGIHFGTVFLDEEKYVEISKTDTNYLEKVQLTEFYTPYVQKYLSNEWRLYPGSFFTTSEENEELSILTTELTDYMDTSFARWVSGDGDVNVEWDSYLKELDSIGLQRYLQLKQQIYDRAMM